MNFSKKMTLALIVFVSFALLLTGCGADKSKISPENTLESFVDRMQAFDLEGMAEYIDMTEEERDDFDDDLLEHIFGLNDDFEDLFKDFFKEKAKKIDYKLLDSTGMNDISTLKVEFQYVDGKPVIKKAIERINEEILPDLMMVSEIDEDLLEKKLKAIIKEETALSEDKMLTLEKDMVFERIDEEWYIIDLDNEVMNVLLTDFMNI